LHQQQIYCTSFLAHFFDAFKCFFLAASPHFSAGLAFIAFAGLWAFGSRFFNRFSLAKVSSGKEPKFKLEATKSWGKLTQLGGLNVKERSRGFKVKNNLKFNQLSFAFLQRKKNKPTKHMSKQNE
jgi:hypothetical protein